MRTIYEIKHGFLGESAEIEAGQPTPVGWTFSAPPRITRGKAAKWGNDGVGSGWVLVPSAEEKAAQAVGEAAQQDQQMRQTLTAIDAERDRRIAQGKRHVFPDGQTGIVQLRHERDLVNVNAVATSGTALMALGDSSATVAFRDAADVTHALTGSEAVQFGLAVMAWVSAHYAAAWAHKDAVNALAEAQDLAGLMAYDVSQGWPITELTDLPPA